MKKTQGVTIAAVALAPFVVFAAFPLPIVALPAIGEDLGVGIAELNLLVSGYALGIGALLLTGGALADRYGAGRVWIGAMAAFALLSAACAVATSVPLLVGARIAAGAAGAALLASSLSLVVQAVEPQRRARAMALWGAAIGAGLSTGPVGAGIALEFGRWRPALAVLAAVAAVAALLGVIALPARRGAAMGRFDLVGTLLLSVGLGGLILGISWVGGGLAPRVWIAFGIAVLLLPTFVLQQRRRPVPLFDVALLRIPSYAGGLVAGLALALSLLSMLVLLGPFLQIVFGLSPLQAGLWFLPATLLSTLVALFGARIGARFSLRARLASGLGLSAVGLAALAFVRPDWTFALLLPGFLACGLGMGLANPALGAAAVVGVPPERSGVAAGAANTARQLGNALGIAVLGAIIHAGALVSARGKLPVAADLLAAGDLRGAAAVTAPDVVQAAYAVSQTAGVRLALEVSAVVALVGAVAAAFLLRPRPVAPAVEPAVALTRP
ncbi:MFS transporter [Pseudonocardia xishanensis]|uniref:MFS transporter n=1 Tax=Pseudonocardia xishanensis TaxID=630995 RepID=A0ABP8RRR9_9PSEU